MRYIKIFEEFISNDIKKDIEDIFLELKDQGFNIDVYCLSRGLNCILIKNKKLFSFSEISEEILRLHEYINQFGVELEFYLPDFTNIPKSFNQLFEITGTWKNKKNLSHVEINISNTKHISEGIFDDTWDRDSIDRICAKYYIKNYNINKDGSINVDDHVDLTGRRLTKIPIRFAKVTGSFYCQENYLRDLQNSPNSVGGHFYCYNNQIENLIDAPEEIGQDFGCNNNRIMNLRGCPEVINGNFSCNNNRLISLNGGPRTVGGVYHCHNNQIDSFEGAPKSVAEIIYTNNPINEIYKLFNDPKKIELFNDYDIVQGKEVIMERLNDFLKGIGKPTVEKVKGYINI